jgi:hypothetical protein
MRLAVLVACFSSCSGFILPNAFHIGNGVNGAHNGAHKLPQSSSSSLSPLASYQLEGRTVANPIEPLTNFVLVRVDE